MAPLAFIRNWLASMLKLDEFTLLNVIRFTNELPLLALTYAVCFGLATTMCSKFLLSRLKVFFDWKLKWGMHSKILSLKACEKDVVNLIHMSNCNPILLRLAWSDAGTYDRNISEWPLCGGCNGSIRLESENEQTVNKGLEKAISLLLPIKKKHPAISWADIIQMAGANSVRIAGGPAIPLRYGRVDIPKNYFKDEKRMLEFCIAQSKKLPCNSFPYPDGSHTPEFHIRNVFFRLGFSCREIVALCGGHTIGRGFRDRTGVCPFSSGDRGATKYTRLTALAKGNGQGGIGMAGGMSWTVNWLQFDNAYFKRPYQNADKSKSKRSTSSSRVSGEEGSRAAGKKRTGSLSSAGSSTQSHSFPLGSYTQSSTSRSVAALESPHVRIEGPDTGAAVGEGLRKMGAGVGTGTGPLAVTAAGEGQTEGQWEGSVGDTSCSDSNSNCSTSSHPSKRSNMLSQPSPSFSSSVSSELLWLPTDEALFKAPEFRFYFEQYAADQCLFFSDYCLAHRKMSELGALFDPPGGIEF